MNKHNRAAIIAHTLLLGGLCASCCVLFYGIMRFERVLSWEFGWELTGFDGIIAFYVFPVLSAVFFLITLRLDTSLKINLALALATSGGMVYISEGLLHLFEAAKTTPEKSDLVHEMRELAASLESEHPRVYPSMVPGSFLLFPDMPLLQRHGESFYPLGGVSHALTICCKEIEDWLMYESDEHGFHNPKGLYRPGEIEIAAIGDSFTHGFCVPSGRNAIDLIRHVYPQTLNLGTSGSGSLFELATFREYVEPLRPDVVLWLYFSGNDLNNDLEHEKQNPVLLKYLKKNFRNNLLELQPEIDRHLMDFLGQKLLGKEETKHEDHIHPPQWFFDLLLFRNLRAKLSSCGLPLPLSLSSQSSPETPRFLSKSMISLSFGKFWLSFAMPSRHGRDVCISSICRPMTIFTLIPRNVTMQWPIIRMFFPLFVIWEFL